MPLGVMRSRRLRTRSAQKRRKMRDRASRSAAHGAAGGAICFAETLFGENPSPCYDAARVDVIAVHRARVMPK